MSGVNWGLALQGGNAGDAFAQSFQHGQQDARQNTARAVMAALVQDPNNPRALAALARVDPQTAMAFRQQQAEQLRAHLGEHADNVLKGAELFRAAKAANPNAPDDQVYAVAYQAAQQAGMPLTDVPPPGDPRVPGYIKGLMTIADGLKPQNDSATNPHYITPQPGGGAYKYDPTTGQTITIIKPNDGSQPSGAPVSAEPPPAAIARLQANPHEAAQFDEIFGPGASQKALGDQTAPAPSGTFP